MIDGLARISGKWCVLIGFDNKVMAGAWIAGQAENQLRVTDLAKRLHIPLVWLVNCSGVKLTEQQEVYADRRGNGTTFFRHAELEKLGIPDPGRDLRDQPGRRRISGHQSHHPAGPQELQHRRGRRRDRQRHEPQRGLSTRRGPSRSSRPPGISNRSRRAVWRSITIKPDFSGRSLKRKPRSWTP